MIELDHTSTKRWPAAYKKMFEKLLKKDSR